MSFYNGQSWSQTDSLRPTTTTSIPTTTEETSIEDLRKLLDHSEHFNYINHLVIVIVALLVILFGLLIKKKPIRAEKTLYL